MIGFEKSEIDISIAARMGKVAKHLAERPAIHADRNSINFSELNTLSDRIARHLLNRCGPASGPIGILLDQGIPSLCATLGVLKAGKCLSIFPPLFPADRLEAIWRDLEKPPVIANRETRAATQAFCRDPGKLIEYEAACDEGGTAALPEPSPDSLGAISYVSTTTGDLKGIMWSNRLILHNAWANGYMHRISPRDHLTQLSAYGFGATTAISLTAILNGAALYLPTENVGDLKRILERLQRERISILSLTTLGLFRQQGSSGERRQIPLPDLRLVLMGGEELFRSDIELFRSIFSQHTALAYRFASNETMMARELRLDSRSPLPAGKVSVGYAVPDKELLLLDEQGFPVPEGQLGEIAIRSRYLASGYWRRPDLTREKFRTDADHPGMRIFYSGDIGRLNPEGQLVFLGRKDNMVKIRGFQVQLEAVEIAVRQVPGVRECSATAVVASSGDKRLAAYIVADPGAVLSVEQVRLELARTLPLFMIPSVYVFADSLPRTSTGKVDRAKLSKPGTMRPPLRTPYIAPRNEMEERLCALWAGVLQIDRVGVCDDFFDLGGDSLLSLHLVMETEETLHREIPSLFFRSPTIQSLIELWETGATAPSQYQKETLPPRALSPLQTGRRKWLTEPAFDGPRQRTRTETWNHPSQAAQLIGGKLIGELAMHLPYIQGSHLAGWLCTQPWILFPFFRPHVALFRRFIAEMGGCPEAPPHAMEINLAGNILWSSYSRRSMDDSSGRFFIDSLRAGKARYWRNLAALIEHSTEEEFRKFFHLAGVEHLQQAREKGQGVIIVTYHNSANRIAMAALPRRIRTDPIPTISITRAVQLETARAEGEPEDQSSAVEVALISDMVAEGLRLLKQGRIIQLVPDNTQDIVGDRPLEVGGREFQIKPGMAEYALHTGAVILPQFSTRRLDGSIQMTFLPPFTMGEQDTNHEEQIYAILRQYAAFVDRSWRVAPEGLRWTVMERFLRKPRSRLGAGPQPI
jgi:acyl-CoA synthetase (AMP-forming)/AMP-acid ligase II/lauroyl/myristoyl acyltransferase/acyl carrier protein